MSMISAKSYRRGGGGGGHGKEGEGGSVVAFGGGGGCGCGQQMDAWQQMYFVRSETRGIN